MNPLNVLRRIGAALLVGAIVLGMPAAICLYLFTGHKFAVVETPSMGTYAPVGTLVLTRPLERGEQVHVGQPIMFMPPGGRQSYFHRVHAIDATGISTKGDLNDGVDPWHIKSDAILGVEIFHLANLGWLVKSLPILLGGALVLGVYLRFFVERYWRVPGTIVGGAFTLAVANYVHHPLVNSVLISKRVINREAVIVFVNTGMLPLDVNAVGGTHGIARQGVIFTASTSQLGKNGDYLIASTPHLEWWVALILGAFALAPIVGTLVYSRWLRTHDLGQLSEQQVSEELSAPESKQLAGFETDAEFYEFALANHLVPAKVE